MKTTRINHSCRYIPIIKWVETHLRGYIPIPWQGAFGIPEKLQDLVVPKLLESPNWKADRVFVVRFPKGETTGMSMVLSN